MYTDRDNARAVKYGYQASVLNSVPIKKDSTAKKMDIMNKWIPKLLKEIKNLSNSNMEKLKAKHGVGTVPLSSKAWK